MSYLGQKASFVIDIQLGGLVKGNIRQSIFNVLMGIDDVPNALPHLVQVADRHLGVGTVAVTEGVDELSPQSRIEARDLAGSGDELRKAVGTRLGSKRDGTSSDIVTIHQADLQGTFASASFVEHEIRGLGVVVVDICVMKFRQKPPACGVEL